VRFPGSLDHEAAASAAAHPGWSRDADLPSVAAAIVSHKDPELPGGTIGVILPGGFSYGDHLRCGAIASRAPIMEAVRRFAADGGRVLGICNGFQMLCEAGLLPGVLLPNSSLSFICRQVPLQVDDADTGWTGGLATGAQLSIPIKNHDGAWFGDPSDGRVVFRYDGDNPTGSHDAIAGIANRDGNVLGLMPHPEYACDPLTGSTDGRVLFRSLIAGALAAGVA
jgi:phosphoribosylformylglycinamidine synthase